MDKRYLRRLSKKLRVVRSWYLFVIAGVFLAIGLYAARQNNLEAIRLRDSIAVIDKSNGDVEGALRNLREYVYSHMNTNLSSGPNAIKPPIQLKYRYERLLKAEKDRVSTTNAAIYHEAQVACEQAVPQGLSGRGRVPCIQAYVEQHGTTQKEIPDSLYKFDFASPFWSPDVAGWCLLAALIFFALGITKYTLDKWLQYSLKNRL